MTVSSSIPIWIDCDPGEDDAFALLLALNIPRFQVVGISTVYGNAPIEKTTHNALYILEQLGKKQGEVKVYSGRKCPLEKQAHFAPDIHGDSGLGGVDVPKHVSLSAETDVTYDEAIALAIEKYKEEICIICTGSLTNIATVFKLRPTLKSQVRYLSIMGGAFGMGNVTEYAEFNIFSDPKAASYVIYDEVLSPKIILSPLNLTHKVRATEQIRREIYDDNDSSKMSAIRRMYHNIIEFYNKAYEHKFHLERGPPVHDPVAVFSLAAMVDDNASFDYGYRYKKQKVLIVQEGVKEGQTQVVESSDQNKAIIGEEINVGSFWKCIFQALENVDSKCK